MKQFVTLMLVISVCFMRIANGQADATAFYSNDLSQNDIFKLVEDRKKWREKANQLQRLLDKIEPKDPNSEAEKQELRRSNSRLYEEKTKVEGLLILTAQNLERAKAELARCQQAKEMNQTALKKANQKVEDLSLIIRSQKSLIGKLNGKLDNLKSIVRELERQLFEAEAFLRQAKLQVFKAETDVFMVTNKRKNIKTSFKDNNDVLPFCRFKKTKKLLIRSGVFLSAEESRRYRKDKPKAEFYLYELGSSRSIGKEKFYLEFSSYSLPPLLMASNEKDSFSTEVGKLFWGVAELDLSNKDIEKGDYYYIIDIEGAYMLTGNLSLD